MPGRLAPYSVNLLIDRVFRDGYGSLPSWYLGLLTQEPPLDGTYFIYPRSMEVTYTGYARQLVTWRNTNGDTTGNPSSGTSGETTPVNHIYFPVCTTSTQLITHVVLSDTTTFSTDYNYGYAYVELDTPIQLQATSPGFFPTISPNALRLAFR